MGKADPASEGPGEAREGHVDEDQRTGGAQRRATEGQNTNREEDRTMSRCAVCGEEIRHAPIGALRRGNIVMVVMAADPQGAETEEEYETVAESFNKELEDAERVFVAEGWEKTYVGEECFTG